MAREVLLVHAASTFAMAGIIWFIQIVHYPLFRLVDEGSFAQYATINRRLTAFVVVPIMIFEFVTAMLLVWRPLPGLAHWQVLGGLALLIPIWLSTFFIQWPQHRKLASVLDAQLISVLIRSNWIRTSLWSARAAVVFSMLACLTTG